MKKIYLSPKIEVINIATQQLIAASITENAGSPSGMDSGSFGSRMDDSWDMMLLNY